MKIKGFILKQTSCACPEQYDVYMSDIQVGYLRLRHGFFRVDYPCHGGETIYEAYPEGDGCFKEHESEHFLNEAIDAIESRMARKDK
jgi:hypothetical protein